MTDVEDVSTLVAQRSDAVSEALTELAGLLLSEETLTTTLERVSHLAARTVPHCDGAGVTVVDDRGRASTAAATAELVLRVDRRQYEADEGPCLEALRTRSVVCVDVSEAAERYPAFAEEAAELGIHSFLAAPLIAGEGALGSLNLYSRSVAGFDALDETLVALFVGQASVAVANARVYAATRRLSEQLADAMASRAVIEQAKGVLIARQGGDEDTAFARLRERSQRSNIKLHEVARQIVAEAGGNGVGASHDV